MFSIYDNRFIETPNLDKLAKDGAVFRNAFISNYNVDCNKAALLTGKHILSSHHLFDNDDAGNKQASFLKVLKDVGYQTMVFGQWYPEGQSLKYDTFDISKVRREDVRSHQCNNDLITRKAINWLSNKGHSQPFCLIVNYDSGFLNHKSSKGGSNNQSLSSSMADESKSNLEIGNSYQEYIASIDKNIGNILNYMDNGGMIKNTAMLYTSLQGNTINDVKAKEHHVKHEQTMRIPLIIKYSELIKPIDICELAQTIDIAPTLVDLAGLEVPSVMRGMSLRPHLEYKSASSRNEIYFHYSDSCNINNPVLHYGIHTGRYKLIYYNHSNQWELYDLENDPDELKNLYDDDNSQVLIKHLKVRLHKIKRDYSMQNDKRII